MSVSTFDFAFDPGAAPLLWPLGIRTETARATVGGGWLDVRFGRWHLATPVANISGTAISGPYSPLKAIGVRMSFSDRGLTFGSTADRGLCITFFEPVAGFSPFSWPRHPNLTVTVEDPAGLARALEEERREATG